VKVVFSGYASPLDSPLPATLPGYTKQSGPWPYDPAKARALLAEAGYPDGFSTVLWGANPTLSQRGMRLRVALSVTT